MVLPQKNHESHVFTVTIFLFDFLLAVFMELACESNASPYMWPFCMFSLIYMTNSYKGSSGKKGNDVKHRGTKVASSYCNLLNCTSAV